MRAIQAIKPGGPSVLRVCDVPDPTPGPGEVLVAATAMGVNFIDTYRRSGVYTMPFPHIPGQEGSGEVLAVGDEVDDSGTLAPGAPIAWADSVTGSYADQVVVKADRVLPLPQGVPPEIAAALPLQGMTADYLVRSTFEVKADHTVALYAAAGGVGGLATQMILATGARLLAVVGTQAKAEVCEELGVPHDDIIITGVMRDLTVDLAEAIHDRTDGEGVDAVFDSIGKDTFRASLRALRRRGTLVLFGGSSGQVPPFDPQELNAHGSLFLTRPTLADYTSTRRELIERARRVFGAAARGELDVRIGQTFPLEEAAAAHQALEGRGTTGKVVLVP
ncbi:MAG: quinone oxidoreductase [Micrococcales bacterium]|nr:quinone oxidoreductase [Micrococcales bacterium]